MNKLENVINYGRTFLVNDRVVTRCAGCGQLVVISRSVKAYDADEERVYYCGECWEDASDDFFICEDCGECYHNDLMHSTDDDYALCEYCYERETYTCEDCGRVYYNSDRVEWSDRYYRYICNNCVGDNYYHCARCGELVHSEDVYWDDYDDPYCDGCWEDREYEERTIIKSYHYHHGDTIHYYGSTGDESGRYIGFEEEVDKGNDRESCAGALENIFGNRLMYETDGSLSNRGFEIISAPHAIEEFYNGNFDINAMLNTCRDYDFLSHDANTCGLHFHLSRTIFGKNANIRRSRIAKMIYFYDHFYDDLYKISRRNDEGLHWCSKYDIDDGRKLSDVAKSALEIAGARYNDRYHAVNITNCATVEIRLFRGTLNFNNFMASLDFVYTIAVNSTKIRWRDVANINEWLKGMKPATIEYIKKRGAFMDADAVKEDTTCA